MSTEIDSPEATRPSRRERQSFNITDSAGAAHQIVVERVVTPQRTGLWYAVDESLCLHPPRRALDESPWLAALRAAVARGIEVATFCCAAGWLAAFDPQVREQYELRGTSERWRVEGVTDGSVQLALVGGRFDGQRCVSSVEWLASMFDRVSGSP